MTPREIAYHEAGHAVAAVALPVLPTRVWMEPRFARAGAVEVPEQGWCAHSWMLAFAVAGPAAQELAGDPRASGFDLAHDDRDQARAALARCPWLTRELAAEAVLRWLRLPSTWPAVERVARELLARYGADGRRGEIAGSELWAVAFAGGRPDTWGLVRAWGEPLRRAFAPGRGEPWVEPTILRGAVKAQGAISRGNRAAPG